MIFFIGKYLLVSRDGHEIVDLVYPKAKYHLLADNVPKVGGATGGLLQNLPIICGGENIWDGNISQDCVAIGQPEMKISFLITKKYIYCLKTQKVTLWIMFYF